jgi:hypothetical protein
MINTKPMVAAIESAERRLEELKFRSRLQSPAASTDPVHEIGALYNLFLVLATAVLELQNDSNRSIGL